MKFTTAIAVLLSTLISVFAQETRSVRAHVEKGAERFRAGNIKESITEFETAARLAPDIKPQLWQLGISYYYAGEFEKGRRLFESHQTVNPEDVENAVWHFLCVARLDGVEAARKFFIPITSDRRVPMKEIHKLFAGKGNKEEVLAAASAGEPPEAELKSRLFYAHLYLGLYEEALKHPDESLAHIKRAAGEFAQPHYMGWVAQVHLKLRSNAEKQ